MNVKREIERIQALGLFDEAWYRDTYGDVPANLDALEHYVEVGAALGRGMSPLIPKADLDTKDQKAIIQNSGYFDGDWYYDAYQDVKSLGVDPLDHFMRKAWKEFRNPCRNFNTQWYVDTYKNELNESINPLVYYLIYGRARGHFPLPHPETKYWWDDLLGVPWLSGQSAQKANPDVMGALTRIRTRDVPVSVIVPVYNAAGELRRCFESLHKFTPEHVEIIAIDDASPDENVGRVFEEFSSIPRFEFHRNAVNLGFTGTVNRGIEIAKGCDVVLLNADTEVTPGWLRRLKLAAHSGDKVATATPLSNNAGAFSAPIGGAPNEVPHVGLVTFARAIAQSALRSLVTTPTGSGFCMYIRRDCLDEVGGLDADAFPRGYGEENDFCMRADSKGWTHVVDDSTYVYHVRSASFGDEKAELIKVGRAKVDERYPDYTRRARAFVKSTPIEAVRKHTGAIQRAVIAPSAKVKPRVLYVLPALSPHGGTPQTNNDLMNGLLDRIEAFLLRSNGQKLELFSVRDGKYFLLEQEILPRPIQAFPHTCDFYDRVVAEWIVKYAFEVTHIRQIAKHSLSLAELSSRLGCKVIFSFHDFYTICPTIKLLDNNLSYCGGQCTSGDGECRPELWDRSQVTPLKHQRIYSWKSMFDRMLRHCDEYITTDQSAKDQITKIYPTLKNKPFHVIPHGRNFEAFDVHAPAEILPDQPLRLLIPGGISKAKGALFVKRLCEQANPKELEIHLLGRISGIELPLNLIDHGPYERDDFNKRVGSIKPHIGGIFSIWPETYCHTLSELWASGIPAMGFDFGAVAGRIRKSEAGWVLRDQSVPATLSFLRELRSAPELYKTVRQNTQNQQVNIRNSSIHEMSNNYYRVYFGD